MLILLSSLLFFGFVTSELKMIQVYGVPSSTKNSDITYNMSWNACLQSCFNSQTCVMAWDYSDSCITYDFNFMATVTQVNSKNGSIVAFKVDTVAGECPTGTNPPTFNNQNATGSLYVDDDPSVFPKWVYYNIYMSGSTWKISYRLNSSCTSDFVAFLERSDGSLICITGYFDIRNTSDGYSYNNAAQYCDEVSAHLTGIWYPEDAAYFGSFAQRMLPKLASNDTYVRIDGKRTTACQSTPTTVECMSVAGFNFSGPPVENFNYYNWVTDSSAQETQDDNCIVMFVNGLNTVQYDVRSCLASGSPFPPKLMFCSSPAWIF